MAAISPERRSLPRWPARRVEAVIGSLALGYVYFAWMGTDLYRQDIVTFGCVYALIALGMYIPLIISGSLSVSYNAYVAVGAYAVGLIAIHTGLSLLTAIPAAIVVVTLVAIGIGFASKGLTGYHLAVATLAVAQASDRFLIQADRITRGSEGIGIPRMVLFGVEFSRPLLLGCGLVLVILMTVAVNRLKDSVWGLSMRLQREDLVAAESCGVPTSVCRLVSLGVGASIACLGGVLYALVNQLIIPESFTLAIIFTVLFVPILGGSRSAWGCVLGSAIVLAVNELGSQFNVSGSLVFGLGVITILLAAPTGILGMVYGALEFLKRGRAARETL
jgi:branched-chain amino acid transport system permease protein